MIFGINNAIVKIILGINIFLLLRYPYTSKNFMKKLKKMEQKTPEENMYKDFSSSSLLRMLLLDIGAVTQARVHAIHPKMKRILSE
jgi:ribosomal protein L20A (L18A)